MNPKISALLDQIRAATDPFEAVRLTEKLYREVHAQTVGLPDPRRDINQMEFGLYTNSAKTQRATVDGRDIIKKLMRDLQGWEETHAGVGASDTAARECMAINIARALGLKEYLE